MTNAADYGVEVCDECGAWMVPPYNHKASCSANDEPVVYTIRVHACDTGYWAEVAEIAGYSVVGPTVASVVAAISEGLDSHLVP